MLLSGDWFSKLKNGGREEVSLLEMETDSDTWVPRTNENRLGEDLEGAMRAQTQDMGSQSPQGLPSNSIVP